MNQTLLAYLQAAVNAISGDPAHDALQAALAHAAMIRQLWTTHGCIPGPTYRAFRSFYEAALLHADYHTTAWVTAEAIRAYCYGRDRLAWAYFIGEQRRRAFAAQSAQGDPA